MKHVHWVCVSKQNLTALIFFPFLCVCVYVLLVSSVILFCYRLADSLLPRADVLLNRFASGQVLYPFHDLCMCMLICVLIIYTVPVS